MENKKIQLTIEKKQNLSNEVDSQSLLPEQSKYLKGFFQKC